MKLRSFSEKPRKLLGWAGFLVLVVWTLALLRLNYWRIYDNTFWVDETWSIRLARMTLPDMVKKTATDMHPPLFYMLAMALNRLLGDNGPAYHLSALIPYMGILFLACTEIRRQFGLGPAFLLVTVMSLMPEPLYFNVEVRMYSLGAFLVLTAYLALRRILTRNRLPEWVIFSLASLGAAYTHYYALISVAFFYLILVIPSLRDRKFRQRTAITWAAAVVGYLPWLGVLLKSLVSTAGEWWLKEIPKLSECLLYFFESWYLAGLFGLIVAAYLFISVRQRKGKEEKTLISPDSLWVLAGLASLAGTAAVGLVLSYAVRPFFVIRYLYPLTPVVFLILGFCLSKLDRSVIEAASDLGADNFQTFIKIILPLSVPGIVSGVSMVFLPAMTNYVVLDMLYNSTYIMGSLIGSYFSAYDWHNGSMIALILLVIICIVTLVSGENESENAGRGGLV